MAEAKSRREPTARTRLRTQTESADGAASGEEDRFSLMTATEPEPEETQPAPDDRPTVEANDAPPIERDGAPVEEARESAAVEAAPPRPQNPGDEGYGFDEEINNRYEEIKRGSTHISELQQMTMPQLLEGRQRGRANRLYRA